ncbi:hypothetical protein EVAR_25620_1 [Eumeta japonica]|uniref:Uncharacterized protein n=1 Tax=Eumeta variegata TaxID=151549 RepID=A0A4C1V285_EUMVA|nr:hypothetical protein EVAR_25620_1 [Eumeta japonica]
MKRLMSVKQKRYAKIVSCGNLCLPFRSNSSGSSINSPLGPSCGMAGNPYAVPLYGGAPVQGYGCAAGELPHYGDMRSASWYPASNDPSSVQGRSRSSMRTVLAPREDGDRDWERDQGRRGQGNQDLNRELDSDGSSIDINDKRFYLMRAKLKS